MQDFRVGPESDGFRLHVANYSGTAGDALTYFHSGRRFSTYDRDQVGETSLPTVSIKSSIAFSQTRV